VSEAAFDSEIRKKEEFRETGEGIGPAENGFDIESTSVLASFNCSLSAVTPSSFGTSDIFLTSLGYLNL